MGGTIEVVNDVSPWLAARTFTGADTDLGILRHVLTVPPDCGSMRLFAAHELNTWGVAGVKSHQWDDCWEIVVCPLGGVRPNAAGQDAIVAAWLWGSGFTIANAWANVDSVSFSRPAPVLEVSGPASGWAVFARPGFKAGSTPADVSVSLHLRAVAMGGKGTGASVTRIDNRCTVPPCVWGLGVVATDTFPSPVVQPAADRRMFRSKGHTVTVPVGSSFVYLDGGPWNMALRREGAGNLSDVLSDRTVDPSWSVGAMANATRFSCSGMGGLYPQWPLMMPRWRLINGTAAPIVETVTFHVWWGVS